MSPCHDGRVLSSTSADPDHALWNRMGFAESWQAVPEQLWELELHAHLGISVTGEVPSLLHALGQFGVVSLQKPVSTPGTALAGETFSRGTPATPKAGDSTC